MLRDQQLYNLMPITLSLRSACFFTVEVYRCEAQDFKKPRVPAAANEIPSPCITKHFPPLKGVQRPAAFAIVCFCFCEFRTVSYSESCGEQDADFTQSMLVFVLPLTKRIRTQR